MIVIIVVVTKNAIVLFYDQMCDCECNNIKEIMLKIVTIFTMVNSLQEHSNEHTLTQSPTILCDDICNITCNYLLV